MSDGVGVGRTIVIMIEMMILGMVSGGGMLLGWGVVSVISVISGVVIVIRGTLIILVRGILVGGVIICVIVAMIMIMIIVMPVINRNDLILRANLNLTILLDNTLTTTHPLAFLLTLLPISPVQITTTTQYRCSLSPHTTSVIVLGIVTPTVTRASDSPRGCCTCSASSEEREVFLVVGVF